MGLGRDLIGGGKGITPKKNDNANKEIKEEAEKAFSNSNNEGGNHPNVSMSGSEIIRSSGAIMFFIGIALGFFLGLQFLAIAILGIILFIIAPYIHMPSGEALITIFIIGGVVLIGVVWFFGVGGGQATAGMGERVSESIGNIFESYSFKKFVHMVQNPFQIGPTSGEYEVRSPGTTNAPPNQAFKVELDGLTSMVLLNQSALLFNIKITNLGSYELNRIDVTLDLQKPFSGCMVFDDGSHKKTYRISNIPAGALKTISVSNAKINGTCVSKVLHKKLTEYIPVGGLSAVATATTYYPTASRLAVERINSDYGTLLLKNGLLVQQKTGAIYRSGSAMTIDMDIGSQPILDSASFAGLLLRWQNVGSGKISTNEKPVLFIITPKEFGECVPSGFPQPWMLIADSNGVKLIDDNNKITNITDDSEAQNLIRDYCKFHATGAVDKLTANNLVCILCDKYLSENWCNTSSTFYNDIKTYAPTAKSAFDWACNLTKNGEKDVCATTSLTNEFSTFSCKLKLCKQPTENKGCPIQTNETYVTNYITAIGLYPYTVTSNPSPIKAYCISKQTDFCIPKEKGG